MKSSYLPLMQSKYYSPAFNSAIFDGPLRIYFAQFHESFALKIYFLIQQRWPQEFARARELSKSSHSHLLVMLYPTTQSYCEALDVDAADQLPWKVESWQGDLVIALSRPLEDEQIENFLVFCRDVMMTWAPEIVSLEAPLSREALI